MRNIIADASANWMDSKLGCQMQGDLRYKGKCIRIVIFSWTTLLQHNGPSETGTPCGQWESGGGDQLMGENTAPFFATREISSSITCGSRRLKHLPSESKFGKFGKPFMVQDTTLMIQFKKRRYELHS